MIFRFFIIPFCVSSYSAISNHRLASFYYLIPKDVITNVVAVAAIVFYVLLSLVCKRMLRGAQNWRRVQRGEDVHEYQPIADGISDETRIN